MTKGPLHVEVMHQQTDLMLEEEPARGRQGENVLGSENGKSSGEERGTEKTLLGWKCMWEQ